MKLLEGKVAIITGASRGIGSGIAKVFAQQGASVAFTYSSSAESAMALENELNALGIKAKGYQSNAADFNDAQKLVDDVIKEPLSGAHRHQKEMFGIVKKSIVKYLKELDPIEPEQRINDRIEKFCSMGVWK